MSTALLKIITAHEEVAKLGEGPKPPPQAIQILLCKEIAIEVLDPRLRNSSKKPSIADLFPAEPSFHLPEGEGGSVLRASIGDHLLGSLPVCLHKMFRKGVGVSFIPAERGSKRIAFMVWGSRVT
ncbi:MAG TPA: hypothetical protein ENF36_03640 [Desulfobacteraceae bacterium]|nr:hypothetical protein [Desulfobacteraceae bacterium]